MKYVKSYDNFINEMNSPNVVSLVAVGDMLAHNEVHDDSFANGEYDYTSIFDVLKDRIGKYDLRYCNAETPIMDGEIHGGEIGSMGTAIFSANKEFGDAILNAGFNLISLANNHVLDNGVVGIMKTKEYWGSTNAIVSGLDADVME
jgi:poly-gamma-glutamate synthesis protein (capsule biosynthesis protein)